ncbi:MAG: phospho-sugar mutase [Bifidobacteriaceae bacterium]|jgi:phosphomannomutase|nr:phospho-sugar mutase [Bifidobacteriaceae bacterium]
MDGLLKRVRNWIDTDVSEGDQVELAGILNDALGGDPDALVDLEEKFSGPIEFGTAGLRGKMQPGESRINFATISKTAFGLAKYCLSQVKTPRIAIGYDARYHSEEFALRSAQIQIALGCEVHLMPQAWPTPLLAFAVRNGNFDAGVMVTASHNPAQDNGYKVYLGGRIVTDDGQGSQIIPPYDSLIANEIAKAPPANEIPVADSGWKEFPVTIADEYNMAVTSIAVEAYEFTKTGSKSSISSLNPGKFGSTKRVIAPALDEDLDVGFKNRGFNLDLMNPTYPPASNLVVVTTAMHGVGGKIQVDQLRSVGIRNVHQVIQQKQPNPDFPTVKFPNPEEPGALDLSIALAKQLGADIIIANDPDADRCSIACLDPHLETYRQLTGDEIGCILGNYFCQRYSGEDVTVASSVVSSRLLEKIAKKHKVQKVTTLTGFKWISRVPKLVFGYEEAIGYNPDPEFVHDKDGPATGSLVGILADRAKMRAKTLVDELDNLARQFGLYEQSQVSLRFNDLTEITALMEKLRSRPPSEFGHSAIVETIDYELAPPSPDLKTNGVSWTTEDDTRVFVRPSGTEPKIKFYIETVEPVFDRAPFDELTKIRARSNQKHQEIAEQVRSLQ